MPVDLSFNQGATCRDYQQTSVNGKNDSKDVIVDLAKESGVDEQHAHHVLGQIQEKFDTSGGQDEHQSCLDALAKFAKENRAAAKTIVATYVTTATALLGSIAKSRGKCDALSAEILSLSGKKEELLEKKTELKELKEKERQLYYENTKHVLPPILIFLDTFIMFQVAAKVGFALGGPPGAIAGFIAAPIITGLLHTLRIPK
jgi:hypothetical protein